MTRKSCAVGMRNAILRNHLKLSASATPVGHFRVLLCLCFKASPRAQQLLWEWLWFAWKWNCMQNSFSNERFQIRLVLKQGHERTRKWPFWLKLYKPSTQTLFGPSRNFLTRSRKGRLRDETHKEANALRTSSEIPLSRTSKGNGFG